MFFKMGKRSFKKSISWIVMVIFLLSTFGIIPTKLAFADGLDNSSLGNPLAYVQPNDLLNQMPMYIAMIMTN